MAPSTTHASAISWALVWAPISAGLVLAALALAEQDVKSLLDRI